MKKIFYSILAAAAILTGCNRELIVESGKGSLSLDLKCSSKYTEVVSKAPQTDEEIINNLEVDITRPYDGYSLKYPAFSEIKGKVVELGSGSYILSASSPSKKDAAFDQPIFSGSKGFDIRTGEVTSVNLTCTISNAMVTISLTDRFVRELSSYTITVSNAKGNLSWTKDGETDDFEPVVRRAEDGTEKVYFEGKKSGYFTVAPLTVTVDGHRSIDGTAASTTYSINKVNAADHHIITLDAEVIGSANIEILISNEVKPIDQFVTVPGFEEKPVEGDKPSEGEGEEGGDNGEGSETPDVPAPSTAPTLEWASNPDFADLQLPNTMDAVVDVELEIVAPEGIKTFLIYVQSNVLSPAVAAFTAAGEDGMQNGVTTMDMINDETLFNNLGAGRYDEFEGAIVEDGLPMKDRILDQTSVQFSLSSLVPLINALGPEIGDEHIFRLNVVDSKGQVLDKTLKFVSVEAE